MMSKKILLCGNYGAGNIGDEAILRCFLHDLRENEITVISANPAETTKKYSVNSIFPLPSGIRSWLKSRFSYKCRKELKRTKKAFLDSNLFILGGGTLLTDTPRASMFVWGAQVKEAIRLNKPFEILAGGIGPLNSKWAKKWAVKILKSAKKITVRDKKSCQLVKKLTSLNVEIVKDPVFGINVALGSSIFDSTNIVILVLRHWKYLSKKHQNEIKKFVHHLCVNEGKYMIGIPFDKSDKKDIILMNNIFDQEGVSSQSEIWVDYNDEQSILAKIKKADLVIGMRLHSLIFAYITKTPFIGISYMDKIQDVLGDLGYYKNIISLEELSFENLKETYGNLSPKASI